MGAYCTNKEIDDKIRELLTQGWRVVQSKHVKLYSPAGKLVTISRSPSDRRVVMNVMRDIRRAAV